MVKRRSPVLDSMQPLLTSLNRCYELAKIHEAYGRLDLAITQLEEAHRIAENSFGKHHNRTKDMTKDLHRVTLMYQELCLRYSLEFISQILDVGTMG